MTNSAKKSFTGTDSYIATDDLQLAVNAAMTLQKPLLIKGEPGTGKTLLAEEVAASLGMPLITWHIKSTTKAEQGLYEYDAVSRLRDAQLGEPGPGEHARGHAVHVEVGQHDDLLAPLLSQVQPGSEGV